MEQQSSSNHIDKSVILILLTTILISTVVLSLKAVNHDPCQIVNFDIKANQYRVGEIIRFKDYTEDAIEREWSFGDDSENRYTEDPFHSYDVPGTYTVQLLVNGKCDLEKEIVIKDKIAIIDSTRIAQFKIPKTIKVGELLYATDLTKQATSWEWRFGETNEVNSTFQNPTYSYQEEGLKTVTLIVNGDPRYSSQKKITVLPAAPDPKAKKKRTVTQTNRDRVSIIKYDPVVNSAPPAAVVKPPVEEPQVAKPAAVAKIEEPAAKQISRSAFARKIIQVSEEQASADDFKEFMCNNLRVTTMAKGKKTTFSSFCDKIRGKKIKIKSLELFKNKKTKCIEYISIDYTKKVF